jgi:hypothetical protein
MPAPEGVEGHSITAQLRGERTPNSTAIYLAKTNDTFRGMDALVSDGHKLIARPDGTFELYDRTPASAEEALRALGYVE